MFDRLSRPLTLGSYGPQDRTGLPVDSGPCPTTCGVNQMSRVTLAQL